MARQPDPPRTHAPQPSAAAPPGSEASTRTPPAPVRPLTAPDGSAPERSASAQAPAGQVPAALAALAAEIADCRACPRLVEWRERVGREKVARFRGQAYWARPVPGFGDPAARICILGLAPAAHGGNRTGRVFTGDRSGDLLYAALFRAGLASQPTSISLDDGLAVRGAYVTAAVRCAPPGNKPLPEERDRCLPYLVRELELLTEARVIVALGAYAWDAALRALAARGHRVRPRPRFGHGAEARVGPYAMLGCFHPSQQNTFTGRLTSAMVDQVLARAQVLALDLDAHPGRAAGARP
ncbi:MAG: uracil-DNA glycosylase [Candidatus Limnocylindrales bacterium]